MENLPNNSGKASPSTTHEKRVDKVVKGEVKRRQSFGKMVRDSFIPEDVENAGSYILSNMIVPGIRDGFFSVLRGILDYWSGGVGGPKFTTSSGIRTQKYSYNQLYNRRNAAPPESSSTPAQRYAYDDIVVPTIGEAEEVIAALKDIIRVYQVARVADLFDLVGVTGSYTDNNYGWPNLDRAGYQRVSGGYLLTFPKAMPIDE
jgi:hypothetical protein